MPGRSWRSLLSCVGPLSEDELGESGALADLDVVWDVLAGGHVGEGLVDFAHDVEDNADVNGFVEFGEDDLVDADLAEALDGELDAGLGGGGGEDEVDFLGVGGFDHAAELVQLHG